MKPGTSVLKLFQVEYPERIDLNLCVGVFRIGGEDLPPGYAVKEGDTLTFDWRMSVAVSCRLLFR